MTRAGGAGAGSGPSERQGPGIRSRLPRILVAAAVLWVIGAVASLFFVPMIVEETHTVTSHSDVVTVTRASRPVVDAEPWVKAVVATVAVSAAVASVLWARRPDGIPTRAVLVAGWVSAVFCFLTGFSIGIFFVPVPPLLFVAAALEERSRRAAPAAAGQSLNGEPAP